MADWIDALRTETERTSQSAAARKLGVSASVVNQVLKGRYRGRLDRVEARVRAQLMHEVVECPVLGEIERKRCDEEQRRPFSAASPQRVKIWRACRNGCPHSRIGGE